MIGRTNATVSQDGGNSPFVEVSTLAEVFDQPDRPELIKPGVAILSYSFNSNPPSTQPVLFFDISRHNSYSNQQIYVSWRDNTTFTFRFQASSDTSGSFMIQDGTEAPVLVMVDFTLPPAVLKDGYSIKFYKYLG